MIAHRTIHLADQRGRDAEVLLVSCTTKVETSFQDSESRPINSQRLIKATEKTTYEALRKRYDDPESLAKALITGDPEVDIEVCGRGTGSCERVFIDGQGRPLYAISTVEVFLGPDGEEKGRRPARDTPANINDEIPVHMAKKLLSKKDAARRFAFIRKYQVRHIDGLTFDFLFGIAEYLQQRDSMALVGSGPKGDSPLILERNGNPYHGFLEGRIEGASYLLILHLASFELQLPEAAL